MVEVVGTLDHKKEGVVLSFGINIFYYCNLFLIIILNRFTFTLLIGVRNYY